MGRKNMPAQPNKHGVFVDVERLVLLDDSPRGWADVALADTDAGWRYGLSFRYGGVIEGAGGYGYLPSEICRPYGSRKQAIDAARDEIIGALEDRRRRALAFTPHVVKHIDAMLDAMRQLGLFG